MQLSFPLHLFLKDHATMSLPALSDHSSMQLHTSLCCLPLARTLQTAVRTPGTALCSAPLPR